METKRWEQKGYFIIKAKLELFHLLFFCFVLFYFAAYGCSSAHAHTHTLQVLRYFCPTGACAGSMQQNCEETGNRVSHPTFSFDH